MRLLTFRNIPIRLHGSFLLIAGLLVGWELLSGGPLAAVGALAIGTILFGSVLLHELGHAMAGRLFGVPTRDITLYPFGGIARMEMQQDPPPLQEVVVSLAGPLVNFVLAGVGFALAAAGVPLAEQLAFINVGLGVFNLVPAFPMDGGRVLRAVLSVGRDPLAATLAAVRVSRGLAWAMVIAAPFVGAWSLALVGGFLLLATRAEQQRALHLARAAQPQRWVVPITRQRDALGFGHPTR